MGAIEKLALPSSAGLAPSERDAIAHLVSQRNALVDRLEAGTAQIERLRADGEDVSRLEDHWIRLLRRYEAVCDRLREHETVRALPRAS